MATAAAGGASGGAPDSPTTSPVRAWTVEEVAAWIASRGYDPAAFRDNRVDGKLLGVLDDEMLKDDLGIQSKLKRARLLLDIADLD